MDKGRHRPLVSRPGGLLADLYKLAFTGNSDPMNSELGTGRSVTENRERVVKISHPKRAGSHSDWSIHRLLCFLPAKNRSMQMENWQMSDGL